MSPEREMNRRACDDTRAAFLSSDLNWLLHRAAQRIGDTVQAEACRHGVGMRAQLVLTALVGEGGRTQLALGAALGLDKTTLTTVLDKLERDGLVVRRPDPQDRRVRIPEITEAGRDLQKRVAEAVRGVEDEVLAVLSPAEQQLLELALSRFIEIDSADDGLRGGSCM